MWIALELKPKLCRPTSLIRLAAPSFTAWMIALSLSWVSLRSWLHGALDPSSLAP